MTEAQVEPEPPTFADAVRFLWSHRVKLAAHFFLLVVIGAAGFLIWYAWRTRYAEGTLALSFRGVERGEYPSGKKLDIADFRAPTILSGALADAGIPNPRLDAQKLSARLTIEPVIPADVLARWKKQDRDGVKREEFVPTTFRIKLPAKELSNEESLRLFDAILKRYRERVKFEQKAALRFLGDWSASGYTDLAPVYDYWEIPYLLEQNVELMDGYLRQWAAESQEFKDPKLGFGFRDLQKDLAVWRAVRLEALKAMTVKNQLVRDRDTALATAKYRMEDLGIEIRQSSEETAEALKLLEAAQKPQSMLATPVRGKEGIPVVDASVFDRLIKSDYIAPLVTRISDLQTATKRLEARKARLEKDTASLVSARNVAPEQLPRGFKKLVATVSGELHEIIERYNKLLENYLNSSITSLVTVEQGPRIVREGPSAVLVLIGLLFCAAVLALFLVVLEASVARALRVRTA